MYDSVCVADLCIYDCDSVCMTVCMWLYLYDCVYDCVTVMYDCVCV